MNSNEITIALTDIELTYAAFLARQRAAKAKNNRYYRGRNDAETHYVGLVGEFGFWKLTRLKPNLDFIPEGGDDGIDFEIEDYKIQLKTRVLDTREKPDLLIETETTNVADYYVLAELKSLSTKYVTFVGWVGKTSISEMIRNEYGKRLIVGREALNSMGSLVDFIEAVLDSKN